MVVVVVAVAVPVAVVVAVIVVVMCIEGSFVCLLRSVFFVLVFLSCSYTHSNLSRFGAHCRRSCGPCPVCQDTSPVAVSFVYVNEGAVFF